MATLGLLRHLLALLGCTVSLYAGGCNPSTASAQGLTVPDAVKTDIYSIELRHHVAFLHDPVEARFLPIWIGKCEAMAIARKLYNQDFPRPLTHDLFQSVLEYTGIHITSIVVDQLRPLAQDTNTFTYFAILTLRKADGTSIQIDSRPSDAMALAVRMDLPVYVSRKILDQNSITKPVPQKPAPRQEALSDLPSAPVQLPRSSEGERVKTDVYNIGLDSLRQYVAFLHDPVETRFLPIWIGECEAMAIARKLYNQDFPRPLTHDLFQSVLEHTGIRITSILVDVLTDETQNSTYRAILTLRKADGTSIRIDSRPSDAMALAVRMDLPVYVSRKILDQDSIPEKDGPQRPPAPKKEAPQRYY